MSISEKFKTLGKILGYGIMFPLSIIIHFVDLNSLPHPIAKTIVLGYIFLMFSIIACFYGWAISSEIEEKERLRQRIRELSSQS